MKKIQKNTTLANILSVPEAEKVLIKTKGLQKEADNL